MHAADQIHGGGEPLRHAGVMGGKAEDEPLGEGGDQPVQQHCQKVEQSVQRRHGEDVAGDERHERGAGEVEEALAQHRQHGDGQPPGVKGPAAQGDDDAQDPGDGVWDQRHGEAGEEVGEKQPFPPDGQRVHQPHAAGVVQIPPHRHGAESGVHQADDGDGADGIVVHLGELWSGEGMPAPVHHVQQDRQRKQGPDKGGQAPQRPEPGQVPAEQCGVKVRCL